MNASLRVLEEVGDELRRARKLFGSFKSAHEGSAVIREEFEELWAYVKGQGDYKAEMRQEAIQLAAMAVRFVLDVCDGED